MAIIDFMANPFDDPDDEFHRGQDGAVKEGLLCPVCVSDFRTINELREHFETNHKNEFNTNVNQSKQIGSQLKDLLNKTKRILKNDSNASLEDSTESMATNAPKSYVQHWRQQMRIGSIDSSLILILMILMIVILQVRVAIISITSDEFETHVLSGMSSKPINCW